MLQSLGGNSDTVAAVKASIGKEIRIAKVVSNHLLLLFTDGSRLDLWDNGQSCCEYRHMETDKDLSYFAGATLLNLELTDAPKIEAGGEEHEIQFLDVHTSKGMFQCVNHNEHNGYYGGFAVVASLSKEKAAQ